MQILLAVQHWHPNTINGCHHRKTSSSVSCSTASAQKKPVPPVSSAMRLSPIFHIICIQAAKRFWFYRELFRQIISIIQQVGTYAIHQILAISRIVKRAQLFLSNFGKCQPPKHVMSLSILTMQKIGKHSTIVISVSYSQITVNMS